MNRIMTADELIAVTGMVRYGAQAKWLNEQFGVEANRRADGSVLMLWSVLEALQARKFGLGAKGSQPVEIDYS